MLMLRFIDLNRQEKLRMCEENLTVIWMSCDDNAGEEKTEDDYWIGSLLFHNFD